MLKVQLQLDFKTRTHDNGESEPHQENKCIKENFVIINSINFKHNYLCGFFLPNNAANLRKPAKTVNLSI